MADPLTPNIGLSVPIRGQDVGTWDIPVNGDFTILDSIAGGVNVSAVTNSPITLTSSQAQSSILRFTGTLTANVQITVPAIFKGYTIDNQITNSPSSFSMIMISTAASTPQLGIAPGVNDILYDGISLKYRNLGKVGEYWDYAGTAIPNWVNFCTPAPYLYCNGTSFSSATYPILANLLGGNVLPDARGRGRFSFNDGTARLSSAGAGIDGNTLLAAGGNNGVMLSSSQIPSITATNVAQNIIASFGKFIATYSTPSVAFLVNNGLPGGVWDQSGAGGPSFTSSVTTSNSISATYSNTSQTIIQSPTPGYVGGLTMIRAA